MKNPQTTQRKLLPSEVYALYNAHESAHITSYALSVALEYQPNTDEKQALEKQAAASLAATSDDLNLLSAIVHAHQQFKFSQRLNRSSETLEYNKREIIEAIEIWNRVHPKMLIASN